VTPTYPWIAHLSGGLLLSPCRAFLCRSPYPCHPAIAVAAKLSAINIDGSSDDAACGDPSDAVLAVPADEGAAPTLATEIRVVYDGKRSTSRALSDPTGAWASAPSRVATSCDDSGNGFQFVTSTNSVVLDRTTIID
jgi:hypothetical protein